MFSALSFVSITAGAAVAYFADRMPAKTEMLETCAGVLLIGGLALIGSALPVLL